DGACTGGIDPGKHCILDHPSGFGKRETGGLRPAVEELEKVGFVYAFVLCALQPPYGDFQCSGRTDGRIYPAVGFAFYLALSGYIGPEFLPGSSGLLRRGIWMAVLSPASPAEKIRTEKGRTAFRGDMGTVAPASGFLLLHHAGYGRDLCGVPDRYLRLYRNLPGLCLYEDQEYLGSRGCPLYE